MTVGIELSLAAEKTSKLGEGGADDQGMPLNLYQVYGIVVWTRIVSLLRVCSASDVLRRGGDDIPG